MTGKRVARAVTGVDVPSGRAAVRLIRAPVRAGYLTRAPGDLAARTRRARPSGMEKKTVSLHAVGSVVRVVVATEIMEKKYIKRRRVRNECPCVGVRHRDAADCVGATTPLPPAPDAFRGAYAGIERNSTIERVESTAAAAKKKRSLDSVKYNSVCFFSLRLRNAVEEPCERQTKPTPLDTAAMNPTTAGSSEQQTTWTVVATGRVERKTTF